VKALAILNLLSAFFLSRRLKNNGHWKATLIDHGERLGEEAYDVIIPTKNNLEVLSLGIISLESQQIRPKRYVFATNGTPEYELKLRSIAPMNSVFMRVPEPFNFAETINKSIELTSSDLILLFNDDVILKSVDATANLLDHLIDSRCLAVGAPLHSTSGKLNHFGIRFWKGWYGVNVSRHPTIRTNECLEVEGVTFALALLRKKTLVSFKLDPSFPLGLNDVDFFIRTRGYGISHMCTRVIAHHDESTTRGGLRNFPESFYQSVRALLVLQEKWKTLFSKL